MIIDGRTVKVLHDYLSPVTKVPPHAEGDKTHPDCEKGVFINIDGTGRWARVLCCTTRTVKFIKPHELIWG